jgi:hypothetical protein
LGGGEVKKGKDYKQKGLMVDDFLPQKAKNWKVGNCRLAHSVDHPREIELPSPATFNK